VRPPGIEEVDQLARLDGIELEPGEAEELLPVIATLTDFADLLDRLEGELSLPAPAPRDPGYVPSPEENPYNAFIRRCRIEGSSEGPLAGLTVGLKDNISLAGVPTTNGSRMSSYTPLHDAVAVERILAAGGTIVGKLNMDDFGASGLGETSAFGPARNPVDPSRSAGGSSGGSGAAVRSGEVDLSLGIDQGGSGRIPAAFCGIVAAKPTHGLVPSWGIVHIDHTIDCVTPLARTVAGAALMLEVISGSDWRDAQWVRGCPEAGDYTGAHAAGIEGLRIAVIKESTDESICEPAVLSNLWQAADALRHAGAAIGEVSIPLWRDGLSMFQPYIGHLFSDTFRSEGQGTGHLGAYDVHAMDAYAGTRRRQGALLAQQAKSWLIADRHIHERYFGIPYAQLHNARLALRRDITAALAQWDLLLTPTLPLTAPKLLTGDASFAEISGRTAAKLCYNTAPLNLSGHPSLSIPSGTDDDGLPTAVQVIGGHFADRTTFRAAFALERAIGPFVPGRDDLAPSPEQAAHPTTTYLGESSSSSMS
jgi:amidase